MFEYSLTRTLALAHTNKQTHSASTSSAMGIGSDRHKINRLEHWANDNEYPSCSKHRHRHGSMCVVCTHVA